MNTVDRQNSDAARLPVTRPLPAGQDNAGLKSIARFAVIIGLQLMYAGFLVYGRKDPFTYPATLTQRGRAVYLPERDLLIYPVGCLVTIALCFGLFALWNRCAASYNDLAAREQFVKRSRTLHLWLLTLGMIVYAGLFFLLQHQYGTPHWRVKAIPLLTLPIAAELAGFFWGLRRRQAATSSQTVTEENIAPTDSEITDIDHVAVQEDGSARQKFAWHFLDIVMPMLLILLIYIPRTDRIEGTVYLAEKFHHWDFFAMAATVGYTHGGALGMDVYSQYGVGWPLTFAALSRFAPLSYGMMFHVAVLYGCVYFISVYVFLRAWLKEAWLAAAGALLAVHLQLFTGLMSLPYSPWRWPSSTILRSPFDIFVLGALLLHRRSGKPIYALLAAAFVGLSILFETDTGIYLTLTFAVYLLLADFRNPRHAIRSFLAQRGAIWAVCGMMTASVVMMGLWVASRGTLFHAGFLRAWLEVFISYPSGISMLPVAHNATGVTLSFLLIGVYLYVVGEGLLIRHHAGVTKMGLMQLCIAVYGLASLILYIGRSHPLNLFHGIVPFCLIATMRLQAWLMPQTRDAVPIRISGARWAVAVPFLILALLFANPNFRIYENLLHSRSGDRSPQQGADVCLFPDSRDVCVPPEQADVALEFRTAAGELKKLSDAGKKVAVISNSDTSLCLAGNIKPFSRYSPVLATIISHTQVNRIEAQLAEKTADYVFLPADDPDSYAQSHGMESLAVSDAWQSLRQVIRLHYTFDHTCGLYNVWRR